MCRAKQKPTPSIGPLASCIGDTHGFHRKLVLPAGDILIHFGDFMVDERSTDEIDDFNAWLGSLSFRHRIVIAGTMTPCSIAIPSWHGNFLFLSRLPPHAGFHLQLHQLGSGSNTR